MGRGSWLGEQCWGGQVWVTDVGCLRIPAGARMIQRNRWQESRPPLISAPARSPDIEGLPRFTVPSALDGSRLIRQPFSNWLPRPRT